MTEHEMLTEICDTIGYKNGSINWGNDFFWIVEPYIPGDVREIIFTQEFMDKYKKYAISLGEGYEYYNFLGPIFLHLDDPVTYLYNLLGLGQKQENKSLRF